MMEGCANMSHDDRQMNSNHSPWYLNGSSYIHHRDDGPAIEYNDSYPAITYEPRNISFLEWFLSNPYKLGFYFLLGALLYTLFLR